MDALVVTPSRIEMHRSPDPVIRVQFPLHQKASHGRNERLAIYGDQAYVNMPAILSLPYGLERRWGFRLQEADQLWVFIPMRPGASAKPEIAVGMIFPCHTLPVQLEVVGGMAIAQIDLREEVDLQNREGSITLYAEKTDGRNWLKEPSLLYGLAYCATLLLTAKQVIKQLWA